MLYHYILGFSGVKVTSYFKLKNIDPTSSVFKGSWSFNFRISLSVANGHYNGKSISWFIGHCLSLDYSTAFVFSTLLQYLVSKKASIVPTVSIFGKSYPWMILILNYLNYFVIEVGINISSPSEVLGPVSSFKGV